MIRARAGLSLAAVLAASTTALPPSPAASAWATGAPRDRAPQIMQMQLEARATPGAAPHISGAEATAIYQRFIAGDTRTPPAPVSLSSTTDTQ